MPLSTKEELDILSRTITPTDSDYDIHQLTQQVAINTAQTFLNGAKSADKQEALAYEYANKMINTCRKIVNNQFAFDALAKVIISIYKPNGDMSTVTQANTAAWAGFIDNNMITAIERVAAALAAEKSAYEALP